MGCKTYFSLKYSFFKCSSLISLPDISKWKIFNSNINISYLESIYNLENEDEDDFIKYFESLSTFSNFYNEMYFSDIKYQMIKPKSNTKEEYKKLLLNGAYNMNNLFS